MKKLLVFGIILSLFAIMVMGDSLPTNPQSFYGTIVGAAAGTVIGAIGPSGSVAGTITTTVDGLYSCATADCPKLVVQGLSDGDRITFTGSGGSISTTTTFSSGQVTNLNLVYTGTPAATLSPGGGGGGGVPPSTLVEVTDPSIVTAITGTLPAGWTNIQIQQEGSAITSEGAATGEAIDAAIALATTPEAKAALEQMKAAIAAGQADSLSISASMVLYKVNNKANGDSVYRTKITLTVKAAEDMTNVQVIEVIAKAVADNVADLTFSTAPTVLQADPIVQWTIPALSKGTEASFVYYVGKKLTELTSKTMTAGTAAEAAKDTTKDTTVTPPAEGAKEGASKVPIGAIVIAAIVIIGVIIFVAMRKKDE